MLSRTRAAVGCLLSIVPTSSIVLATSGYTPCPPLMELPCDGSTSGGSSGEGTGPCGCGTGQWVVNAPPPRLDPPVPMAEDRSLHEGLVSWTWSMRTTAQPELAMASISVRGRSNMWAAGSFSRYSLAHYVSSRRELWSGGFPACPRLLSLAATGGATLHISASTAARRGCSAFASAATSGTCSSLGAANASIESLVIAGSVGYSESTQDFEVAGNFGPLVDVLTDSVEGSLSASSSWSTEGQGSHSGSASVTVRPDRIYCAFTNRPYVARAAGQAVAGGAGSVEGNGSTSWSSMAVINLSVQ